LLWYRYGLLSDKVQLDVPYIYKQLLPIICVGIFGIVSACIVLYRTFTFNNCDEAAVELRSQIEDAKKYLKEKGLVLDS